MKFILCGTYVGFQKKTFTDDKGVTSNRYSVGIAQPNEGAFNLGLSKECNPGMLDSFVFGQNYIFDVGVTQFNGTTYFSIKGANKYDENS